MPYVRACVVNCTSIVIVSSVEFWINGSFLAKRAVIKKQHVIADATHIVSSV